LKLLDIVQTPILVSQAGYGPADYTLTETCSGDSRIKKWGATAGQVKSRGPT